MPSGLYIAASGMDASLLRENVISNNLANISTVGFKQDRAVEEAFPTYLISRINDQKMKTLDGTVELRPNIGIAGGGVIPQAVLTDFSYGPHLQTNNPLDLAISGSGFFAVKGLGGKVFLTRDGGFSLDGNGRLVNKDGLPVLGHNGEVYINGNQVEVDSEGNITVDGKALDKLLVVKVSDEGSLKKMGHSLFQVLPGNKVDQSPQNVLVQQGFVEQSNVNAISEMVRMIEVSRAYEMNAKIVSSYDAIMDDAATQLGTLQPTGISPVAS